MKKEKKKLSVEEIATKKQKKKEIRRGALIVIASMLAFSFIVGASVNGIFAASKYLSKLSAENSASPVVQYAPQTTPEATQQATSQVTQQANVDQSGNQATNTQNDSLDGISAEEKREVLLKIQYDITMIAMDAQMLKIYIDAYDQFDGWSDACKKTDLNGRVDDVMFRTADVYTNIKGWELETFLLPYDSIPVYDNTVSDITFAKRIYRFADRLVYKYDSLCDSYGVDFEDPREQ